MPQINFNNAEFLLSAVELEQLPPDRGAEVAFIGRSNAGKSSALNAITDIKGLARISKTPGRTQAINLFRIDHNRRLIDLPGYGYAKVPLVIKQRWEKTVNTYLQARRCLRGLVIVMDIRHPLKESDWELLHWAFASNLSVHILLTKVDKLKHGAAMTALKEVKEALKDYQNEVAIQLFSSLDHTGVDEARGKLQQWLEVLEDV